MAKGLFDLKGKVTVVTGGNSGIGLGFARGIAKQGGDLAIWARSKEKNAVAQQELASFGVRVTTRQVDVTSEKEVAAASDALVADIGRVDSVFANSAMAPLPGVDSILDLPTEEYHKLINLNLHGAYYTLREGARHMVKRAKAGEPGGSLVQCGSLSMFVGLKGKEHYAAAKGAMGAVVPCLAVELGPYGIRVNTLAPASTNTTLPPSHPSRPV